MLVSNYREIPAEPVIEGAIGVKIRWMITEARGAENFVMRHFEISPKGYTPLHTHHWEHEIFILSGQGVITDGKNERPLKEGDVVFIPKGETHQFKNPGDAPFTLLCMIPSRNKCSL